MVRGWQAEVQQAVTGLGYELVEMERPTNGLLRVFIERTNGVPAITVDDCEKVTRHLQYLLEVQQIDYQRLEVSSPGLDRPLKTAQDYARFVGERVEVTFHVSVEIPVKEGKAHKQKRFIGILGAADASEHTDGGWLLEVEPEVTQKKRSPSAATKKKTDVAVMVLNFQLDEVKEARLAPIVEFNKKKQLIIEEPQDADALEHQPGDEEK